MQGQWRLFASALTLGLFAAFAVTPSSPAKADGGFVGSWIGTVAFNGLALGDLLTLNRDRTVTLINGTAHASQLPFLPPGSRLEASDGLGTWKPIGNNQAAVTAKWLLFFGPNNPPDPEVTAVWCPGTTCAPGPFPGQNIGLSTVQLVVTLQRTESGDTVTGEFTAQYANLNGEPVGDPGTGTLSYSRIAVEEPDRKSVV